VTWAVPAPLRPSRHSPITPCSPGLTSTASTPSQISPLGASTTTSSSPASSSWRLLAESGGAHRSGDRLERVATPTTMATTLRPHGQIKSPAASSPGRGQEGFAWTRGHEIGAGSYGSVFKALDRQTGRIFAVKEAAVSRSGSEEDRKYIDKLKAELDICKDLRHPNIVSYLGHESASSGSLYIYLEYVPGGSMSSMLAEFGALEGSPLRRSTAGLLEGLDYLHTRSPPVVHRDIKGANILVDLNFCVKLADFGCSKCSDITTSFTALGSIPWMAPEVIQQQAGHGRKADIWSLGCTIIEMATAEKPWGKSFFDNPMCALRHIGFTDAVPAIAATVAPEAHELISRCLRREPEQRPWASELLRHDFVVDGRQGSALVD